MSKEKAPARPNLRELITSKGRVYQWVAEQLGLSSYSFTDLVLNRGRATPTERKRLQILLEVSGAEIDAALEESERRPK